MKAAVYWGCKIPTEQYAYEMSTRQVLPRFNIELVDLENVSCCGTPVRSVNTSAALYLSVRNLAIAGQTGLDNLLIPCNECHFMLSEARNRLDNDSEMQTKIQELLNEEGLEYPSNIKIWHTIDLLHDFVNIDTIRGKVRKPLEGLKFAVHPGCQIIRPSEIGRVDHPENPRKLDRLVEALGAQSIDYSEKLDCCGAALLYSHLDAALSLAGTKLRSVQTYGADGFVNTCPYCHTMYDARQKEAAATVGSKLTLSVVYYTQLLGHAIGIDHDKLGLHLNQSFDPERFTRRST
ncbi:MAG: CoB--CoM heterodisulfide reductase iron-sulfur subunit B family protein [Candidatus Bathyarchaeota archaeon]|nr:MAG: CoB--CoM heterodisulfide reductase iron-sulfur subunit B family protein [Candidatus Bathyarchaeota archaeon]